MKLGLHVPGPDNIHFVAAFRRVGFSERRSRFASEWQTHPRPAIAQQSVGYTPGGWVWWAMVFQSPMGTTQRGYSVPKHQATR